MHAFYYNKTIHMGSLRCPQAETAFFWPLSCNIQPWYSEIISLHSETLPSQRQSSHRSELAGLQRMEGSQLPSRRLGHPGPTSPQLCYNPATGKQVWIIYAKEDWHLIVEEGKKWVKM